MKNAHKDRLRNRPVYSGPMPPTITYTCERCRASAESGELPRDPKALRLYPLPPEWRLVSALVAREGDDGCLCSSCAQDVLRGYPLDLRDLGRGIIDCDT
jgi:hypothetical protein